jgi:hypothetical protein
MIDIDDSDEVIERHLVVFAAGVHVADIALDLLALLIFLFAGGWDYVGVSVAIFVWTALLSGCYVCYGTGDWGISAWITNVTQMSLLREAWRSWNGEEKPELFYTLRLLQAVLQSAPQGVLQLSAALLGVLPFPVAALSFALSTASVALGLTMWEQKVSNCAAGGVYPGMLFCFRFTEMVSRASTIALVAVATPHGFSVVLVADFVAMLLLLSMQQAVSAAYRVFVALPLVFVSIEPLIWPRPSHAVPKEHYYVLRVCEFLALWGGLVSWGNDSLLLYRSTANLSLISTVCLYILLPCVWRLARERELGAMAQAEQADSEEEAEALSPHRDPLDRHAVPHADSDEDEERELTERLL